MIYEESLDDISSRPRDFHRTEVFQAMGKCFQQQWKPCDPFPDICFSTLYYSRYVENCTSDAEAYVTSTCLLEKA